MEANRWPRAPRFGERPSTALMASMKQSLQQNTDRTVLYIESEISVASQGQQAVQAVVQKATTLFAQLQAVKLNNDNRAKLEGSGQLKEVKDTLDALKQLFVKLRRTYDECNRRIVVQPGKNIEEMIPLRKENKEDDMEISQTENSAVNVSPEHQELELKLRQKNQQLKELIDKMRSLIWDINMMMVLKPR